MVTAITSFGRSGLYDWLVQRISAVVLLAYVICVGTFIAWNPDLQYEQWLNYIQSDSMRIFSMMALVSLGIHAWVGLWSVATDYLTVRMMGGKATILRLLFQSGCGVVMFTYFVWAIQVLWSI
jgi:succinate dehydrogenase / fumarate reductase membrane anchor subunit